MTSSRLPAGTFERGREDREDRAALRAHGVRDLADAAGAVGDHEIHARALLAGARDVDERPEDVALGQDPDERALRVEHGQTLDALLEHDRGGLLDRRVRA